jgi:hypothetical protein
MDWSNKQKKKKKCRLRDVLSLLTEYEVLPTVNGKKR